MKCRKCKSEKNDCEMVVKHKKIHNLCKECNREISREYYAKNREKSNQKRKELYQKNRLEFIEKQRKRYFENREEIRKIQNEKNKSPERREKARIRSREYAQKNADKIRKNALNYKRKNPQKAKAHQHVMWAIKLGILNKPKICSQCLREIRVEAHHKDYDKPLEVIWLCRLCHLKEHGKLLDVNPKDYYGDRSELYLSSDKEKS